MPYVNDLRVTTCTWYVNGQPVAPTTVTLKFSFGGVETTWVYGGTGSIIQLPGPKYQATIPASASGEAVYEWIGTGNAQKTAVVTEDVSPLPL